jgi:hypothetical protein
LGVQSFVFEFVKIVTEFLGECFQNRTVGLIQFGPDDESHFPVVILQRVDSAGCNGEGTTGKVTGYSVVANAPFERRNVELVDEVCAGCCRLALVN